MNCTTFSSYFFGPYKVRPPRAFLTWIAILWESSGCGGLLSSVSSAGILNKETQYFMLYKKFLM